MISDFKRQIDDQMIKRATFMKTRDTEQSLVNEELFLLRQETDKNESFW